VLSSSPVIVGNVKFGIFEGSKYLEKILERYNSRRELSFLGSSWVYRKEEGEKKNQSQTGD